MASCGGVLCWVATPCGGLTAAYIVSGRTMLGAATSSA